MAGKSNIRSMRFSDTIIEMIEQQAGDTFTAKFEALVTKCVWELPKKEQELKRVQELIQAERKRLDRIQKKAIELENKTAQLTNDLTWYARQVQTQVKRLEEMCNTD